MKILGVLHIATAVEQHGIAYQTTLTTDALYDVSNYSSVTPGKRNVISHSGSTGVNAPPHYTRAPRNTTYTLWRIKNAAASECHRYSCQILIELNNRGVA